MLWQDWVITLGSLIFVIALFPSVHSKDKPALLTSLITGTVLIIFAISYLTLSLWTSAITTFLTGAIWFVLAIQKYTMHRK